MARVQDPETVRELVVETVRALVTAQALVTGRALVTGQARGRGQARSNRGSRDVVRMEHDREPREYEPREYESRERAPRSEREPRRERSRSERKRSDGKRSERTQSERAERQPREARSDRSERRDEDRGEREMRFYLQRNSPIVDAPSIGARMGERLEAIGIHTVNDLLEADAESIASALDHRRIDASTIMTWQQQATLVCRIPLLRGHDAQLLVAAEVTTPEEVAAYDPNELFALIKPISKSSEGKRILRGGKLPDLEEMNEWISQAQQNRALVAA